MRSSSSKLVLSASQIHLLCHLGIISTVSIHLYGTLLAATIFAAVTI